MLGGLRVWVIIHVSLWDGYYVWWDVEWWKCFCTVSLGNTEGGLVVEAGWLDVWYLARLPLRDPKTNSSCSCAPVSYYQYPPFWATPLVVDQSAESYMFCEFRRALLSCTVVSSLYSLTVPRLLPRVVVTTLENTEGELGAEVGVLAVWLSILAVKLTRIAWFPAISPSILNRFSCNFAKAIFYSNPNSGKNLTKLYLIFQKLDHLTCNKILELV